MITKLITLLTLLFASMHISNNIVKDGGEVRDEVSLSRPQKTTLREIKNARDYNDYYGNNCFHILDSKSITQDGAILNTDNINNTITLNGSVNQSTTFYIPISRFNVNSSNPNIFLTKFYQFSGSYSGIPYFTATFADSKQYLNKYDYIFNLDGLPNWVQYNKNEIIGNYELLALRVNPFTFNDFTFSFYIFNPSDLDHYVPYGDIYTGKQVDDDFDEYRESQSKESYPLYGAKVTYVDNDETYVLNNLQPSNLNNLTYKEMYDLIDPSIETWNNTCTLTFDFNSSIIANDLILYSFMFNKIQIYQSNGDLFFENDYGYNTTGSFDISSLSLNDTQKNQFINKVVLTFTNSSYRPSMQKILLRVENKVNSFSYEYGYDKGKEEGEKIGYNIGVDVGDEQGYNRGYNDGRNEAVSNKNYNAFTLVSSAFSSLGKLLNVEIYNGLTIGVIFCIPIIFAVVLFIIKMIKG